MLLENKEREPRESPSTPKADGPMERALNVLMVETDIVKWYGLINCVGSEVDRFDCEYWKRDSIIKILFFFGNVNEDMKKI